MTPSTVARRRDACGSALPTMNLLAAACAAGILALGLAPPASAQTDTPGTLCAFNRAGIWIDEEANAASYLDRFDLQYERGPWLIGARLEYDEETRLDPELFTGIRRRFAEYRGTLADLRVGTFYATFGRGLLLRAEEDEIVRLDRDIDGARGVVRWNRLTGQAVFGRPRHDETHERDDLLSGLELRAALAPGLSAGGGYVRRDASRAENGGLGTARLGEPVEELAGGSLQFSRGIFDGVVEWARRYLWGMRGLNEGWVGIDERGHALYGAFTFSLPGYAWLIEGKHYQDFAAPYSTLPPANAAGQPINNGRDERGIGLTLTANRDDLVIESAWSWADAERANEPGRRYSAEGRVRRDWWGRGALAIGGDWVREVELESHALRAYHGPRVEASYYLTPTASLELHGKAYAWENQVRGSLLQDYNEVVVDLSLSIGDARGATLSVIHASEPVAEYDFADTWVALELAWAFSSTEELKIKVGDERGGIVCSGGVCHYEPPFSGVRAELVSRF